MIPRILTALILLPLLFSAIVWLPFQYFALVLTALILLGAWEWASLINLHRMPSKILYVVLIACGMVGAAFINITWILSFAVLCWLWIGFGTIQFERGMHAVGLQLPAMRFITGFPVLIGAWASILTLKSHPDFGAPWLLFVLGLIFAADTGAYFAGIGFGKKLLCPRVSPKKTWEGLLGGLIASCILAVIAGFYFSLAAKQYLYFLLVAVITVLFSVAGDLGLSLLKRIAGIKDSGKIFPGHGGMLDRLDSVAAASVVFVLIYHLFFLGNS